MAEAAARFASYGEADWRRAAEAALKGAGFATLISRGADGIELQPLYPRREGPRALRGGGGWRVLARLDHPDPAAANEQALDDLANGADGLQVVFAGAAGAYGFGLAKADSATLHRAFEGVRFDAEQRFELDLGPNARSPGDRLRGAGRAQRRRAEVRRRRLRPRSDRRAGAQRPRAAAMERRGRGARQGRLVPRRAGLRRALPRRRRARGPRRRRNAGAGARLRDCGGGRLSARARRRRLLARGRGRGDRLPPRRRRRRILHPRQVPRPAPDVGPACDRPAVSTPRRRASMAKARGGR